MSRQHFEAAGKLFPCPNRAREFKLGKLLGQWRWASDSWSHLNEDGNLVTTWLGITRTETPDGLVMHTVIVWKLCLMLGITGT